VYRLQVDTRGVLAAGLLQATSLPFIVATTGMGLGTLSPATGAALLVAGLLSVVLFPLGALTLLRSKEPAVEQASGYRHQVHRDGTHHSRTSGCIRGFPHSRE
jgi:predicted Kef-type K+ transport protein